MKVRIVEDTEHIAEWLEVALEDHPGLNVVRTTHDFERLLAPELWEGIDAVLCDADLGTEVSGLDILRYLKGQHPSIWRVLLTAQDPLPLAAEFAHITLNKPADDGQIVEALKKGRANGNR